MTPLTQRLSRILFRVCDAERQTAFYRDVLGMRLIGGNHGYSEEQALLDFEQADVAPYTAGPHDLFWKIGITVRNLDIAVAFLREKGVAVSTPQQFRDIGYLCHLQDPEGFTIELLQQGFEGNHRDPGPGPAVGGQATLAHLTLRVQDIEAASAFYGERLGMRLMSVQPVADRGFTLYFYSWSSEPLPNEDLQALQNREWLWARPYTLLELQHVHGIDAVTKTPANTAGFAAVGFRRADGGERILDEGELHRSSG